MLKNIWVIAGSLAVTALTSSCASVTDQAAREPSVRPQATGSSISRSTESPASYAPVVSSSTDPGLSPTVAVAKVLSGLDASLLTSVHLGISPAGGRSGPWFYATVTCPTGRANGGCVPALWQADLAQGAVAELMNTTEANLANVVVGATLRERLPDGSLANAGGDQADIATKQKFLAADESDAQIVSDAKQTIAADGFTATTVKVYRPLGPALYVVAQMPTAAPSKVTLGQLATDLNGNQSARFEGIYVEVDTPDGSPIGRSAATYRSGAGRLWFDPKYEDVIGILHGGHATA